MSEAPISRSPVRPGTATVRDGWEVDARIAAGQLTLSDETPLAKVHVRAPFDRASRAALGVGFGRTARADLGTGEVLVIGSGPGEWLLLGAPGTAGALRAAVEQRLAGTGEFTTVLDLTHGRALVRLTGREAATVLAGVCAIDFSDAVTPDGTALRTSLAAVVTDIARDDRSGVPSYLLHVERSSGQYLADALLDAGRPSGLEVTALRGIA
ncbi:sarcosine oxidase subunit gamma [Actinomycetospora aeridis]|uniref:Aminomethyltransferase folate-binding domain-containing protein n=1 Tax=Actinomycetospora aeridis TaxID=3129231 RepID=A0ABU8N040_9PSEU